MLLKNFIPLTEHLDLACLFKERLGEEGKSSFLDYFSKILILSNNDASSHRSDGLPVSAKFMSCNYHELLNRVIGFHVRKATGNLISLGYRIAKEDSFMINNGSLHGIENFFPNTLVNELSSSHFALLSELYKIGEVSMFSLLSDNVLIKAVIPSGYIQLTGPPLHRCSIQPSTALKFSPADVTLNCSSFVYHRPPPGVPIKFGFPETSSFCRATRDHSGLCLMKHIFTSNPGLSPSILCLNSTTMEPMRLIFQKVIRRHNRINFTALVLHCCPTSTADVNAGISASCKPRDVLRFCTAVVYRIFPMETWGSKKNFNLLIANLKNFLELGRTDVVSLHQMIQGFSLKDMKWLFGNKTSPLNNFCSRDQHSRATNFFYGFFLWFWKDFIPSLIAGHFYVTETTVGKNRLFYFRQDMWLSLVSLMGVSYISTLYESFFLEASFVSANLGSIIPGVSNLRFLPKDNGFRPIVNLTKKVELTTGSKNSINTTLKNLFEVLKFEKARQDSNGQSFASVLGLQEIYQRLKNFKMSLKNNGKRLPPCFYMAKVDFKGCFDTIPHQKLLDICMSRDLFRSESYIIYKFAEVDKFGKKRFSRFCVEAPHFCQFSDLAAQLFNKRTKSHNILVDNVVYSVENRSELLKLLEKHITMNVVKIDGNYFRQKVGIPQGSIVSSLLCSIFYSHLDKTCLSHFFRPDTLLLRFIDDFLCISTEESVVEQFVSTMNLGFSEYNATINPQKTITNLNACPANHCSMTSASPLSIDIPWCGLIISGKDLSITGDFSLSLKAANYQYSLTLDITSSPFKKIEPKLLRLFKLKCHAIFLDLTLNSKSAVFFNIAKNYELTCIKFIVYLRRLAQWTAMTLSDCIKYNQLFLVDLLTSFIHKSSSLLRKTIAENKSAPQHLIAFSKCQLASDALSIMVKVLAKHPEFRLIVNALRSL